MTKQFSSTVHLVRATLADYPIIQNMARFYVYDMSRDCGFISGDWSLPKDGLYESYDFKDYFIDETREAFLVKTEDELAGFVLLNKIGSLPDTEWNMGEFFIIAKFQSRGVAQEVANQIWKTHPGKWEVSVIPENKRALHFWRKVITHFTHGHYHEVTKEIDYDKSQSKRYILSFDPKANLYSANIQSKKSEKIEIEKINPDQAETLCRSITQDLPEYFGILSANEQYFKGVRNCKNLAAKINGHYVGLLSLNFPYANNSNIYWMGVLRAHQAKGVGRQLIEKAGHLSRKINATTMTVETLSPEESDENYFKTYQFYQSSGFKPVINLKPEGYEWKMVYMVKPLDSGLYDLLALEKDAKQFGFDWPTEAMIIGQVMDECNEIKEAIEKNEKSERIQEEIGDLLHAVVSLCEFAGFDVEDTLHKINEKFGKRMRAIKKLTHELGLPNLQDQSFEFMLDLWRKAKAIVDEKKLS